MKKDPGIPNLFPFKDKILAEIEEKKRLKAEQAQCLRAAAKAKRNDAEDEATMEVEENLLGEDGDLVEEVMEEDEDESNPMAALLASAQARAAALRGPEGERERRHLFQVEVALDNFRGQLPVRYLPEPPGLAGVPAPE